LHSPLSIRGAARPPSPRRGRWQVAPKTAWRVPASSPLDRARTIALVLALGLSLALTTITALPLPMAIALTMALTPALTPTAAMTRTWSLSLSIVLTLILTLTLSLTVVPVMTTALVLVLLLVMVMVPARTLALELRPPAAQQDRLLTGLVSKPGRALSLAEEGPPLTGDPGLRLRTRTGRPLASDRAQKPQRALALVPLSGRADATAKQLGPRRPFWPW